MIVWGGFVYPSSLNTGGRYDPASDSWTPTSTLNAPSARYRHTAVWTGSERIVWGDIPRPTQAGALIRSATAGRPRARSMPPSHEDRARQSGPGVK